MSNFQFLSLKLKFLVIETVFFICIISLIKIFLKCNRNIKFIFTKKYLKSQQMGLNIFLEN